MIKDKDINTDMLKNPFVAGWLTTIFFIALRAQEVYRMDSVQNTTIFEWGWMGPKLVTPLGFTIF